MVNHINVSQKTSQPIDDVWQQTDTKNSPEYQTAIELASCAQSNRRMHADFVKKTKCPSYISTPHTMISRV